MSTEQVRKTITFPIARIGYPKLNPTNPPLQGIGANKKKQWSTDIYLDPDSEGTKRVLATIQEAVDEFVALHERKPSKSPELTMMGKWANAAKTRQTDPSLLGKLRISLRARGEKSEKSGGGLNVPPGIVDADREPIPHTDIYPGCYARVVAVLREYEGKEDGKTVSHGLSFELKLVQFVRDGDRMGGDTTDYTKFLDEEFEEDDEAPAPKGPFKGAVQRGGVSDDDI